jgi:hypothetical protein
VPVDDGATVQLGVSGDIGIDAGQEVWVEGGSDLGAVTRTDGHGKKRYKRYIVPDNLTVTAHAKPDATVGTRRSYTSHNTGEPL